MKEQKFTSTADLSKIYKICLNANISSLMYGYGIVVFSSTMFTVSSSLGWGSQKTLLIAIMTALFPFGGLSGAMLSGSISGKYGVWKAMCITDVIGIVGALVTIIPFTPLFAIGRFISGLATGMFACLVPGYVFEMSPTSITGKTGSMFNVLLALGIVLASLLGLALPLDDDEEGGMQYWWMFMFGFQAVVYALQMFNFIVFFRYESKSWLANNGGIEEVEPLATTYNYGIESTELKELSKDITQESQPQSQSQSQQVSFSDIFTQKYRKMLRLAVIMAVCFQFSGINGIVGYSISLYLEMGSSLMLSRILSVVLGLVEVLGAVAMLPFVDKYGRKTIFIVGSFAMTVSLSLAAVFSLTLENSGIAVLVLIYIYAIIFQMTMGTLLFVYFGEVLNSKIMSIAVGMSWIGFIVVVFAFPFELANIGIEATLFIYAVICAVFGVYLWFDMVETKGLNRKQIHELFFGKLVFSDLS